MNITYIKKKILLNKKELINILSEICNHARDEGLNYIYDKKKTEKKNTEQFITQIFYAAIFTSVKWAGIYRI